MADLTILYYSACRISDRFADAVRAELVRSAAGRFQIVCVSHKPIEFGDVRIVVGDVQQSIARVYLNILEGCNVATTRYCAAAEDDTLYTREHFDYRPSLDTFAYNEHRVVLTRRVAANGRREAFYFDNPRTQMAQGIFSRALMIETLEERFAKHPNPPLDTTIAKKAGFGEPGRYEKNLGLPCRKLERFKWASYPNVVINHAASLMGRRAYRDDMPTWDTVEPWGNATELWRRIVG